MGTSNRVFKCSVLENNCDDVLLRVYGESASLLVDRDHELAMISRLSDSNVGAHLYASFENGMCSFILNKLQILDYVRIRVGIFAGNSSSAFGFIFTFVL